jgi:hypothetical protein
MLTKTIDDGGIPLADPMPSFKDKFNDTEKLAVISYFQNFWDNEIYKAWLARSGLK